MLGEAHPKSSCAPIVRAMGRAETIRLEVVGRVECVGEPEESGH